MQLPQTNFDVLKAKAEVKNMINNGTLTEDVVCKMMEVFHSSLYMKPEDRGLENKLVMHADITNYQGIFKVIEKVIAASQNPVEYDDFDFTRFDVKFSTLKKEDGEIELKIETVGDFKAQAFTNSTIESLIQGDKYMRAQCTEALMKALAKSGLVCPQPDDAMKKKNKSDKTNSFIEITADGQLSELLNEIVYSKSVNDWMNKTGIADYKGQAEQLSQGLKDVREQRMGIKKDPIKNEMSPDLNETARAKIRLS